MSQTTRTWFPRYEILAELGRGGMSEVYKARDKQLDRIVALKLLSKELVKHPTSRERFEREARAGAQLDHDHIVTTYDSGIRDGSPFLAVSYIEGETLEDRILRKRRLSPEDTIRLVAPIAEALDYTHRKGVIHRDVKPANILIRSSDDRPILIDFGIGLAVASSSRLTQEGARWGTIAYMSPEQARADTLDGRTDLYSLGVVLYECLAGRPPFESPHTDILIANIKNQAPPPIRDLNPDVPDWLARVVARSLAKDPDDRYQTGNDLAAALGGGVPPPRERHATIQAPPRERPRKALKRAVVALVGAALVVALAWIGFLWWANRPADGGTTADDHEQALQALVTEAAQRRLPAGYAPVADPVFQRVDAAESALVYTQSLQMEADAHAVPVGDLELPGDLPASLGDIAGELEVFTRLGPGRSYAFDRARQVSAEDLKAEGVWHVRVDSSAEALRVTEARLVDLELPPGTVDADAVLLTDTELQAARARLDETMTGLRTRWEAVEQDVAGFRAQVMRAVPPTCTTDIRPLIRDIVRLTSECPTVADTAERDACFVRRDRINSEIGECETQTRLHDEGAAKAQQAINDYRNQRTASFRQTLE